MRYCNMVRKNIEVGNYCTSDLSYCRCWRADNPTKQEIENARIDNERKTKEFNERMSDIHWSEYSRGNYNYYPLVLDDGSIV